ncbi:hypothetical protein ENHAE0001_0015 [Enhydrobacter aerosaccus SK60]|nr:hypothetical protein ENHAE0001_0015 [Enhydrobacter aerosaccus SK60]
MSFSNNPIAIPKYQSLNNSNQTRFILVKIITFAFINKQVSANSADSAV